MSTRATFTPPQAPPSTSTNNPHYHTWPAPWPSNMAPMVVPPARTVQVQVVVGKR